VEFAGTQLIEAEDPMLVFSDPEVGAAFETIDAYESESCGLGGGEDEGPDQDASVTELDPNATRIDVAATDFAFDGDIPTESDRYSFVMQNDGEAVHLIILAKLAAGATMDEVMASEGEEGLEASYESDIAAPGAEAIVTADLT